MARARKLELNGAKRQLVLEGPAQRIAIRLLNQLAPLQQQVNQLNEEIMYQIRVELSLAGLKCCGDPVLKARPDGQLYVEYSPDEDGTQEDQGE